MLPGTRYRRDASFCVWGAPAPRSRVGHIVGTTLFAVPVRMRHPPVRRFKVVYKSHDFSAHPVSAREWHSGPDSSVRLPCNRSSGLLPRADTATSP